MPALPSKRRSMRIALDGIPLSETRTGVGHYTFELALALAESYPLDSIELVSPRAFTSGQDSLNETSLPPNLKLNYTAANVFERRWFVHGLPSYIRRTGIELFHGTNFEVPFRRICPSVLTVHDLSLILLPHTHLSRRVRRARLRLPLMVRAATMIITPTEAIRREVCYHLGVALEKVVTVPEAPRKVFRPSDSKADEETLRKPGINAPYFLAVGTLEPRKNLRALVLAYRELIRSSSHRPWLVIAGKEGWMLDDLRAEIERAGPEEHIHLTGYVSDEELRSLYSSCVGFVFPSLYEGFGLPPLEAMACGAPVIANRIPSLREVLGEAASFVDAENINELKSAMLSLIETPERRAMLSDASRNRAANFSWERTAAMTRSVYETARRQWSEIRC
jgi:glycosyltransferase involved in cell wall biosynthesis